MYDSGGLELRAVAEKIGVGNDDVYKNFAVTLGDIILGVYKKESLGQLLKDRLQLSEEQVKTAVSGLSNLLSQIPEIGQNKDAKPFIMPKLQTNSETGVEETIEVQENTEQRDEAFPTVKPLRTFSDDAHNVHGYGSFRQDLGNHDDTPVHRSAQDSVLTKKSNDEKRTTLPTAYPQYPAPIVNREDENNPSTEQPKTP